jgi:hypothetical protein
VHGFVAACARACDEMARDETTWDEMIEAVASRQSAPINLEIACIE